MDTRTKFKRGEWVMVNDPLKFGKNGGRNPVITKVTKSILMDNGVVRGVYALTPRYSQYTGWGEMSFFYPFGDIYDL